MSSPRLPTTGRLFLPAGVSMRNGARVIALLVLLVLLLGGWQISRWYESSLLAEQRAQSAAKVSLQGNVLSLLINRRLARLQGLYAFVQARPDEETLQRDFESFASALLLGTNGIRNLAVGPDGAFTLLYPRSGNEIVFGYRPLEDERPEVRADAQRAIDTGQVILSGPVELLQGGQGLIGRQAVYRDGEYWGLISIVLDMEGLLSEAGLVTPDEELLYGLRDGTGRVFFGAPEVFEQDPVINVIDLPEGVWELAAVPHEGWQATIAQPLLIFRVSGLLIALLLTTLTYVLFNSQARLQGAVQQRTVELSRLNRRLEQDIARRERVEMALRQRDQLLEQRVAERTQELQTLLQVSRDVASTLELEPLLAIVLDELKTIVSYTGALLLLWEEGELVPMARRGVVSAELEPWLRRPLQHIQAEVGWDGWREAVIVADLRQALQSDESPPAGIRSWMAVPLLVRERPIGAVLLYHNEPNHYTARHEQLAAAVAGRAAVAIDNARLYEQAQRLAVLQERQRLARELHDSVSQALYGIALGARTAQTLLERDTEQAAEPLAYVLSLAEAGLTEMRALIFELRPETLETEGLIAALSRQTEALQLRHEIEVVTSFDSEPEVGLPAKEALYRVAQEAINNIIKHARATQVNLSLQHDNGHVVLSVGDNGKGFDVQAAFPGHLGLQTMRERIERLGGVFQIESGSGAGTRVQVTLPLAAA